MLNKKKKILGLAGCLTSLIFVLVTGKLNAQATSVNVETIQKRYKGKWLKSITYIKQIRRDQYGRSQEGKEYHADLYPGLHRIDNGDPGDGNASIIKGDSLFLFKAYQSSGRFVNNRYPDEYILGDIYYDAIDDVKKYLISNGVDINKSCFGMWEGKKIYVLGATNTEGKSGVQIWYDLQGLYPVRFIDFIGRRVRDTRYKIKTYGLVWFPVAAQQFISGKHVEDATYSNVTINASINADIFDIQKFGTSHWYKQP
ncbi:hypothetical protein CPT03_13760 [Pedobacter ginsengisoli]|uniref:Uncharacterized protein n=1 Tax=Pedobacter ginsengisoli TaxID=363852 RepID=A0A2D1U785_9SPHI|nr:hypothetical protein [Pedobacter ginsengisoli]ATP57463.1 hypothetical protein CPT03_13760 [Pedobacter ginsengisoli]